MTTSAWLRVDRQVAASSSQAIAEYLAGFGRNGVPLYVFYPPGGAPIVLPQVLTASLVQDTLDANLDH